MDISLQFQGGHHFTGTDAKGMVTHFDAPIDGADPLAASPMSIMLQSLAACTSVDIVDILHKKRKTVTAFSVRVQAERADEHPRVFTSAVLHFTLTSPDAALSDLERCIELSQEKYCSVAAMFKRSGCALSSTAHIVVA
ncbi:MAG: OsmC family protein [Candidatus Kapaibacterium sp.]